MSALVQALTAAGLAGASSGRIARIDERPSGARVVWLEGAPRTALAALVSNMSAGPVVAVVDPADGCLRLRLVVWPAEALRPERLRARLAAAAAPDAPLGEGDRVRCAAGLDPRVVAALYPRLLRPAHRANDPVRLEAAANMLLARSGVVDGDYHRAPIGDPCLAERVRSLPAPAGERTHAASLLADADNDRRLLVLWLHADAPAAWVDGGVS